MIRDPRIAFVVPRDSVVAAEQEASRLGWKTPTQTLRLAGAFINVMTVLSRQNDSISVYVAVQRLRTHPSPVQGQYLAELAKGSPMEDHLRQMQSNASRQRQQPYAGLESRPFAVLVLHRDDVQREMFRMARGLADVFDEMRSCDMEKHSRPWSLPWCWMEENTVGLLKDYKHRPFVRWTNEMTDNVVPPPAPPRSAEGRPGH